MSITDRLYRRVMMTSAGVTISQTDDTGPVHKVQGKVRGTPEVIDNLQTLNLYGFASHAPVGSDAMVIFGNGDRSNGVIVSTANQGARPRNQKQGEVTIHDNQGSSISLLQDGTVQITAKRIVLTASNEIDLTAPVINFNEGG